MGENHNKNPQIFNEEGIHHRMKFKTPEDLQTAIDNYFSSCYKAEKDEEGKIYYTNIKPLTIQSLVYFVDVTDQTWYNYAHGKHDTTEYKFSEVIAKAKKRIEAFCSETLFTNRNQVAMIFNLKSNYGWQDTQKIDLNHSGDIKISFNDSTDETPNLLTD
ncbi:MAG: terminase small subunit [Flavobacteriales bacterium]